MTLRAGPEIRIGVTCGDVLGFTADVLALKHAGGRLYGADRGVVAALDVGGIDLRDSLPGPGDSRLVETQGVLKARRVLFLGTPALHAFDYAEIREFGRGVLAALALQAPGTRHVALTLHGIGYGLDESEVFRAEIAGLLDAIAASEYPAMLERITIVEISEGRAARLSALLAMLDTGPVRGDLSRFHEEAPQGDPREALRDVGEGSQQKAHIFVAMPFAPEFDDVFHYGIQGAVNAAGFLCERADLAAFTGDVIARVKERIASAALLVADLSSANPNVYLEVGYAWGREVPSVLVANHAEHLKFDVQGQHCLIYNSIRHLEESLTRELKALKSGGIFAPADSSERILRGAVRSE
jgi:hypothetical protein